MTTVAPRARGRGHGAAAADHHGPQQGLAEGGDPGWPGAGPAAASAAAHRDVHRDHRALVALGEQVDRQVVEHPAVDEQPPVLVGDRREQHGQPDRGQRRRDGAAAPVHLAGAAHQVGAHGVQLPREPLEDLVGAERTHQSGAHPPPPGQRLGRKTPVAERLVPDELGVADLLQGRAVAPDGVGGGDDGADAGPGQPVDVQAGVLELAQHPDVRERPRAAAGEHQAERASGQPGGQRPEAAARVLVDDASAARRRSRPPRPPAVRARVPARPAPRRAAGRGRV